MLPPRLRDHWNLLAQTAVWAFNIVRQFVAPPPSTALACPPDLLNCLSSTEQLAKYGLAVMIGLTMIATHFRGKRPDLLMWIGFAIIAFAAAYGSYAYYYHLQSKWICDVSEPTQPPPHNLRLKGETFIDDEVKSIAADEPCKGGCKQILSCFDNDPKQVWKNEEIDRRRLALTGTYFSVLPLFVLCIICTLQAIYCATQKGSPEDFKGYWESMNPVQTSPEVLLIIRVVNKKVSGELLNINALDSPEIFDARIQRGTLIFFHGRARIRYEMDHTSGTEASLSQKEIDNPKSWDLVKRNLDQTERPIQLT